MTSDRSTGSLAELRRAGVAVWLDDLDRARITSGNLAGLVTDGSVVGVTTNPTIFAAALRRGEAYGEQLRELSLRGVDTAEALRAVMGADVRAACDVLRGVYDATGGQDGRVSLEVDPRLAGSTERTVAEARALWWLVDRPNLYIKIPATPAGVVAIAEVLGEGISVNVTLIFSRERYRAVMEAYLTGCERLLAATGSLAGLGSVASFFVSRVDTEIDRRLAGIGSPAAAALRGRAAIANARLAYRDYEEVFSTSSPRWQALRQAGAVPQRPLWASTGVKDPSYPDTRYVDELVAAGTVNTMPEATLQAVREHGHIRPDAVRGGYPDAERVLADLATVGISLPEVTEVLEREGIEKFTASFAELTDTVAAALAHPVEVLR